MRQSRAYQLDPTWLAARNRRVRLRLAGEIAVVAVLLAVVVANQSWPVIAALLVACLFLGADLYGLRGRDARDASSSIEVGDTGLRFRTAYHDAILVPWQDLTVRGRESVKGRLAAVVINIGPGGGDVRIEGYADLEDLEQELSSRVRNDA